MSTLIATIGFIGFLTYIILGIFSFARKNGKAKKQWKTAGILFILFIIGAATMPTDETEQVESEAKAEDEKQEKEVKKEEKKEIPHSSLAEVAAALKAGMPHKDYEKELERNLNVTKQDTLPIGNGNSGEILEAADGVALVGTDGKKVLSVNSFKTADEAKIFADQKVAEVESAKKAEQEKQYEESKVKLSGSGDTSTDVINLEPGFAIFDSSYSGGGNFIIELVDENGNAVELLVNEIGSYKGKTFALIPSGGDHYLNVTASGSWNVSITQAAPPSYGQLPGSISGTGDDVVFMEAKSGNYKFTSSHQGKSNFIVTINGSGLLVNEIGNYNGSIRQKFGTDGVYAFVVNADGPWSIKVEK